MSLQNNRVFTNFRRFNIKCRIKELMMNLSYNFLSTLIKFLGLYSRQFLVDFILANNPLIFQYNLVPSAFFPFKRKAKERIFFKKNCSQDEFTSIICPDQHTPNIFQYLSISNIGNKSYLILSDWDHLCSTDAKIS